MVFQLNPIILWGTQKSPGFYVEVRPCGVGSPLLSMGSGNTFYVKPLTLQELPTHVLCTNDMSVHKISGHLTDMAFTFSKRDRES